VEFWGYWEACGLGAGLACCKHGIGDLAVEGFCLWYSSGCFEGGAAGRDLGVGKEGLELSDILLDLSWASRADVPVLGAGERREVSVKEAFHFQIDVHTPVVREETVVEGLCTTIDYEGCNVLRHEDEIDAFGASSVGGWFILGAEIDSVYVSKVVLGDDSREPVHVESDVFVDVTAEDDLVAVIYF
jgi:hypothetical protein